MSHMRAPFDRSETIGKTISFQSARKPDAVLGSARRRRFFSVNSFDLRFFAA
ncbi:hypothetical protein D3C86_2180590 [compost metagenome]